MHQDNGFERIAFVVSQAFWSTIQQILLGPQCAWDSDRSTQLISSTLCSIALAIVWEGVVGPGGVERSPGMGGNPAEHIALGIETSVRDVLDCANPSVIQAA